MQLIDLYRFLFNFKEIPIEDIQINKEELEEKIEYNVTNIDKDAPTVPLPLTIALSINLASGNRCDNIPNPNIRIRIIEKADNIFFDFFLAIFFPSLYIFLYHYIM